MPVEEDVAASIAPHVRRPRDFGAANGGPSRRDRAVAEIIHFVTAGLSRHPLRGMFAIRGVTARWRAA
jgi:hypothetical protein